MKKRILFLLLTVMTLLSNTVFSQTYVGDYVVKLTPLATVTSISSVTETFPISLTDVNGTYLETVPVITRQNNDSIIYEFIDCSETIKFNIIFDNGYSPATTGKFEVTDVFTTTTMGPNSINSINMTQNLIFNSTKNMYKITIFCANPPSSWSAKFVCYVRNYHVAKLPSNTVIPFVANFSSSVTNYTATSLPTTITLPAPTSTVTWTQVLSYTTSNCVTYTEGANTLQDCDTLTTLFISNNNSNVNYTITYNRPAQDITSIKEVKSVTSIVTYPNPCKDFIKVKFNTEQSILPIELYNLQGQLLLQNNEKRKLGANEIEFNTQKLPNGVYFVKNGAQTVKFIKE